MGATLTLATTSDRTGTVLQVELGSDVGTRVVRALASDVRSAILQLLQSRTLNVSEIAEALGTTMSATSEHIKILSEVGLITTEMTPGTRGLQKACGRAVDAVVVNLPQ
ncbi:MAG: helix-turn-helix domain-containing protein, partial [Acidimicrobiia bacterium]|nr:helix-turn-helix domain-containing protein [Acidimicrobiia bacterium]